MDFEEVRQWYDGYDFPGHGSIYNPYSVMCAMRNQKCRSYWQKTSAAESLMTYINMDFQGLQETISRLISGEEIEVGTLLFENDFETFRNCDDVLRCRFIWGTLSGMRKKRRRLNKHQQKNSHRITTSRGQQLNIIYIPYKKEQTFPLRSFNKSYRLNVLSIIRTIKSKRK